MSPRLFLAPLAGLLLAATLLPGAAPSSLNPELYGTWDPSWTVLVPPVAKHATVFRVYQLNLLAAEQTAGGVRIHRLSLGQKGFDAAPDELTTKGLPKDFALADLQVSANAGKAAIASADRVYTATITAKAEVEKWEPLADMPLRKGEKISRLAVREGYLLVLTDRPMVDDTVRNAGWMADLEAPEKLFRWLELPPTPAGREGFAPLVVEEALLLGGGRARGAEPNVRRGETFVESLPLNGPDVGKWTRSPIPLFESVPDAVGAAYGSGLYLTARTPRTASSDQPTSQGIYMAIDRREDQQSSWRKLFLPEAPSPVRALAVDPGHNNLLMFREATDGGLLMTALPLPESMQARATTGKEVLERAERKLAEGIPPAASADVLAEAKRVGLPAVLVISSDADSADVRSRMTTSKFRYMTMGSVPAYLAPADGRATAKRYGITKEPAFLLVDPVTGKEISRHEGSFPTDSELLRFTSPIRQPKGTKP